VDIARLQPSFPIPTRAPGTGGRNSVARSAPRILHETAKPQGLPERSCLLGCRGLPSCQPIFQLLDLGSGVRQRVHVPFQLFSRATNDRVVRVAGVITQQSNEPRNIAHDTFPLRVRQFTVLVRCLQGAAGNVYTRLPQKPRFPPVCTYRTVKGCLICGLEICHRLSCHCGDGVGTEAPWPLTHSCSCIVNRCALGILRRGRITG
jgi:hypothetical protein